MKKRYECPKLQSSYEEQVRTWRRLFRQQVRRHRAELDRITETAKLIEPLFPDFFVGSKIYCRVAGASKADFSRAVEHVAQLLGEPPTISVNPGEYCADFEQHSVHVFLRDAEDCKLIQVEEVVTKLVSKPHPECLAALKTLEDIA